MGSFPEQRAGLRFRLFGRKPPGRRETPGTAGRPKGRQARRFMAFGCAAAALALFATACGGSSSVSSLPTNGNTATWAEIPGFTPVYIFPFTDAAHYGIWNMNDFQDLMYRPLYWYGNGESPTINASLSLAGPPAWSADSKTVTITLKPYKWSNGETVDASDVLFWMNMYKKEKANFGGYVPGYIPDNVSSVTAIGTSKVQFHLTAAYNHNWFLYNELSQITPLPKAWDRTASGPGDCAGNVNDCTAVYSYLIAQNKDLAGYASSPVWGVVDGPWKLQSYNPDGSLTMVPNKGYSGPVKPKLSAFREVQFTSQAAEYNTLKAGTGTVQVGYIEPTDITQPTNNPAVAGPNPLSPDYVLTPWIIYSINYFPMNMNNPTVGPIFRQTYFRQALQYTIDTSAIIKNVFKGYGYLTTNGVPVLPASSLLNPALRQNPFPFSIGKARQLLTSNGWNVSTSPGTCVRPGTGPGECGAGISKGEKLSFSLQYASGNSFLPPIMESMQSDAGQAGIQLNLSTAAGEEITANDTACTPSTSTPCTWQMGNWGAGWVFAPDYYPSGEELFMKGSLANYGSYADPANNAMIKATLAQNATNQTMYNWESYIAKQAPVVWQPDYANPILEVAANLKGVTPLNTFDYITPESWYYAK